MTTDIQTTEARDMGRVAESLVTRGDLSDLTPAERARHYINTCEGLGLNPASQPFSFLTLQGKLVMYANRGASDQLAAMHRVTRRITRGPEEITLGGQKLVICVAEASMPNGRVETSIATVPMADPVNVLMKAETKAKRRVTLSILGLGMLDETELETIPASAKGPASQVDFTVTVQRDDAPAQLAAPDALAAFRAALDATESLDLDGARVAYARHDLGGTSLSAVTVALVGALAVRGYRLTGTEAGQLLRGELSDALALAYDQLAAVSRHADDDDGDGVVADVVRVLRSPGVAGLAKAAKSRVMTVAVQTCAAHDVADGDVRIRAALAPVPPTTPTGTDAPRASTSADVAGGSVAPAESAGATMRLAPEAARTRDEWREYLEGKSSRTEIENAVRKHGRLSADLVELAGWRLQAITPPNSSGYRTPLRIHQLAVAAWAEEGPRKEAAQRKAAATLTTASQLGKAA